MTAVGYFRLRGLDVAPSCVGLGGWPIGGHSWGARDDAAAERAVRTAVECGITFFDTADVYGLGVSEKLLAEVLASLPGAGERVVVATKGGVAWDEQRRTRRDSSPQHLRKALEASLGRLRRECIDLYYLHWPDGVTPIEESLVELVRFRDQGKIRAIGLSNVPAKDLGACAWASIAAVQIKGNLLEPSVLFDTAAAARGIGAAVVCYSALADGLLAGNWSARPAFSPDDHRCRYPLFQPGVFESALARVELVRAVARRTGMSVPQVALRWLLDCGAADAVLVGSTNSAHIVENYGCNDKRLDADTVMELAAAVPMETCHSFEEWRLRFQPRSATADATDRDLST